MTNQTLENMDDASLSSEEREILNEIAKLEEELKDPENPSPTFQLRLLNLLRIPNSMYNEMLESVRDLTCVQENMQKQQLKKQTRLHSQKHVQQKKEFLKETKDLKNRSWFYKCFRKSRRISNFRKFFLRLNPFRSFIQIAAPTWALLFWQHVLYLHFVLALAITSLEITVSWNLEKWAGKGSSALLGHARPFEYAICGALFVSFLVGWFATQLKSKGLTITYMLILTMSTISYLIYANVGQSNRLEDTMVDIIQNFILNPTHSPFVNQMQIQFACCGAKGPMDYLKHETKLPDSCCLRGTMTPQQQKRVHCVINGTWPLELNEKGCGKVLAHYLNPTFALKYPLSLGLIYLCLLSFMACITFMNLYRRKHDGVIPTTRLTLGEKLLVALDTHRISIGDSSDATVDTLRRRLGQCETISQIIYMIIVMIDEVEDLLRVDPYLLAHEVLKVNEKEIKFYGQVSDSTSEEELMLDPCETGRFEKSLISLSGKNGEMVVQSHRSKAKVKPESDRKRIERLLAEVIHQSQNSVRSMKNQINLMRPLASTNSPEAKQFIPIAAKLLQTVTEIRSCTNSGEKARPSAQETKGSKDSNENAELMYFSNDSVPNGHPKRAKGLVSGKVLTSSQFDMEEINSIEDPMEHVRAFHPDKLDQMPDRKDVGLRTWKT